MKLETFEYFRFKELTDTFDLKAEPIAVLTNNPCEQSEEFKGMLGNIDSDLSEAEDSYFSMSSNSLMESRVSFKGGMKLPPIGVGTIEKSKDILDFLRKIESGKVGENDRFIGIAEGYIMVNWEDGRFFGGRISDKGAMFKPKKFSDDIKVYKDAGTGFLYVQEPLGHLSQLRKVSRWERDGFSYVYNNYFGHEVAIKWQGKKK